MIVTFTARFQDRSLTATTSLNSQSWARYRAFPFYRKDPLRRGGGSQVVWTRRGANGGGTGFVKDDTGQVVKSKLDEKRLKEIAETTGGFYIHLEDGPRTMKQLFDDGVAKMQSGEIDERLSRQPIERYQWPLGLAFFALMLGSIVNRGAE